MPKKLIALESFEVVMDELSKEVKKILDDPTGNKEERVAFVLFLDTLKVAVKETFGYLPKGEWDDLETMCAVWMDVGILLGRSPQLLVNILKRTGAKIEEAKTEK